MDIKMKTYLILFGILKFVSACKDWKLGDDVNEIDRCNGSVCSENS